MIFKSYAIYNHPLIHNSRYLPKKTFFSGQSLFAGGMMGIQMKFEPKNKQSFRSVGIQTEDVKLNIHFDFLEI